MPKKKTKISDNIIYNIVSLWTSITDEDKIRREVDKWTKQKHELKEEIVA